MPLSRFPGIRLSLTHRLWIGLALTVMVFFWWTLRLGFLGDDFAYVQRFYTFPFASWPGLFVREWSGGIWGFPLRELRPIAAVSFMLDTRLWGLEAAGYHATNLLLHIVCSGLVMMLTTRVLRDGWWPALFAGLLFALHPVHTETVAWISARADLLGTLGFLAALYAFFRFRADGGWQWLLASWVAFGAGIFSKEFCLTLPIMALCCEALNQDERSQRRTVWSLAAPYLGWGALFLFYYLCRLSAAGPDLGAPPLNYLGRDFRRAVTQRELVYFWYLVPPSASWLPLQASQQIQAGRLFLQILAAGIVALAAWTWFDFRRGTREVRAVWTFGLLWFLVGTIPFVITYASARHLYLASAGMCIATVAIATRWAWNRRTLVATLAALSLFFALELRSTGAAWRQGGALALRIDAAVKEVAAKASAGEVLILDVPATVAGATVWSWASPFALRPPFQSRDLAEELIVLERPDVYFFPENYARHRSIERLEDHKGRIWMISASDSVTVSDVPAAIATPILTELGGTLRNANGFDRLAKRLGAAATP